MPLLVSLSRRGSVLDRLKQVLSRAENLEPLVQPAHDLLWNASRDRALRGVDPQGNPYAPLAPATLEDRARKGYPPGPPLVRKGDDSDVIKGCVINTRVERGKIRFSKSFVGTTNYHIQGGPNLPVRDPLGWSDDEMLRLRALVPPHVLGRR